MQHQLASAAPVITGVTMAGPARARPRRTAPVRRHRPAPATVALLAALAVTGCTTADADDPPAPPEAATSPAPDPDPGPAPDTGDDPEAVIELPGEDELAATWAAFHDAWTDQAAVDQPDPDAFHGLAGDPDTITAELEAHRAGTRLVTLDRELWTDIDLHDGHAAITDCVVAEQHPADQPDSVATITLGWEATATLIDGDWRIETARPTSPFCIADELNDQLLDAYRAFREAKNAAWDPPDPDHPGLAATMTGEQLAFVRDLLADHRRDGIVIREPAPTDNAVVFDVGIGTATVSDCVEQVPGYGAFDLETGEALPDLVEPAAPGRLDAQSVDLVRQPDGSWLVADQAASRDTSCVPGSTPYALQ